jgi:hypothetical protein
VFVLFPTTVVAGMTTFVGIVYALAMLSEGKVQIPLTVFTLTTFGTAGIISLWILFLHFFKNKENPSNSLLHSTALLAGAAVSTWFVVYSGGTLLFRLLFFGWPLIGAAYFLILLLINRRKRTRSSST